MFQCFLESLRWLLSWASSNLLHMTRLVVALFALIRISTPHQTCLDRFCSSLASPPSPTTSYASCTSSSSVCSIIAASALPGPPGQGQPSQESWHWCGAPPSSSPSHYSLELHMGSIPDICHKHHKRCFCNSNCISWRKTQNKDMSLEPSTECCCENP